ncbi:hypothetical protein LTT02_25520 [Mycolicibacterium smegmatis]|uniref:hypothetical protein n=1 Tax=Mycolicibacterium smegmatis TaxID=1772 RepID=UPI0005D84C00|nr:hypothetical protein [Mycolicibacterium smegmatis]MDF1903617.1 hypothetical protein [Mycolicibacterium smegmatis]MDF1910143.1 hypothetical protein [Mycolicibacterium smegmatis]MDF1921994.1 hypothetical protein [Mycolicibacterium smegmatis]MDF1928491.1 hypothetical protein [Mycolicibacterium smegmatis]UAK57073.1 hypothetical protein K8P01_10270 [Mycolicibacterium smegmatis]
MNEVKYPEYRQYQEISIDVNNAVMSLLAGSRIANHAIVNNGTQNQQLADIFPTVEHIDRFNLRVGPATKYLSAADDHLASMEITYALAVHEDFVTSAIEFARSAGVNVSSSRPITAKSMHRVLFNALGYTARPESTECFQLLRCMRNAVVHAGRRVQQELTNQISNMSPAAVQEWQRLNGQPPSDVVQQAELVLVASHIFSAFAVIKQLGRDISAALAATIPVRVWAEVCVQDFQESTKNNRNSSGWRRALIGYARSRYGPVNIPESDLESAARTLGLWTIASWQ